MTSAEQKFGSFKRKLQKQLAKPIGHHDAPAAAGKAQLEMHAPMPETHGQGAQSLSSEQVEQGKLCAACNSPAHAHDTKCPWCGAAI